MRYQLKKQELLRACFYIVGRYIFKKLGRKRWMSLIAAFVLLLLFLEIWNLIFEPAPFYMLWKPVLIFILFFVLWYMASVIRTYRTNIRGGSLNETELSLENGILKLQGGQARTEFPASQIARVIQKKELLYVVMKEIMGQERYYIIPDRAFLKEEEKNDFLKELARAAACPGEREEDLQGEPLYDFSFFVDKDFLVNSLALTNQESLDSQNHYGLRVLFQILIGVAVGVIFLKFLYGNQISGIFLGILAVFGMLVGFWAGGKKSVQRRFVRQLEKIASKGKFLNMLGNRQTAFYEGYVLVKFNGVENRVDYASFQKLLDSPDMYIFYGGKYGYSFSLPKQAIPAGQREEFLAFCREKILCCRQIERIKKKSKMSKASRILLITVVVLVLGAAAAFGLLILEGSNKTRNHTREDNIPEYDADFKFRPADYPDYLPIEEQIEVLKKLGFEVPDEAADYYHGWMDDNEYGKMYVEGYPYYVLLSDLGTPNYDMDTYQFLGYSGQVYWFAYESWDISKDYMKILEGVQALTDEEVAFIGANENCEDVNWRKGTGSIRVTFWCNGHPYEFKANVDGEWLDKDFITFLNNVLDEEGFKKQLYACPDNDEGCILLYRDEAWAEEFMEKTGLALSLKAQ